MDKKSALGMLIALIVAGAFGYYTYTHFTGTDSVAVIEQDDSWKKEGEEVLKGQTQEKEAVLATVSKTEVEAADNATAVSLVVPDLNREITFFSAYPEEQKEKISSQIKDILALLKQDASLFNEWLDLGLLRKAIGDYGGAREAWEYASAIRPQNSLSFSNLGVLYGYYLGNAALAEKNYLKGIENDPKLPYLYAQTADFYLEVMKNKEKAKNILEKGLKEVPGDEALKAALENI